MAMGQAAGTAAAQSIASGLDPRDIDVAALRERLRADGAILELAESPEIEVDAIEAPATR
jgi:hypothetical protein